MNEPTAPIADAAVASSPVSSETATSVSPSDTLASLSTADRATWRETGKVPGAAPVAEAQGDGDPGETHEAPLEAAPVPAAPVPDPAASAAGAALNKHKRTAQDRINDLARDKYRLEGENAALRSQLTRPATAADPAAPAPTPAPTSDALVEPKEEDFETYKDFVKATARYEFRLAQAESDRTRAEQQGQTQLSEVQRAHDARLDTFRAVTPDFDDVIRSQTQVYPTPLLAAAVLHSELAPQIAYHLNTHLDEYRALVALPAGPMLKALGRLEARLEAAAPAPAAAPLAKHVTTAPAPPVTLGARPALPADAAASAIARGDFASFRDASNARDLAARR